MKISDLRRDPRGPCEDFWHSIRVGLIAAGLIFVIVSIVSIAF